MCRYITICLYCYCLSAPWHHFAHQASSGVAPPDRTRVADFHDDYQFGNPPTDWNYQWNANGPIGVAANYVDLNANGMIWDSGGHAAAGQLRIDSLGGRPGLGIMDTGSGGIERHMIVGYEVPAGEAGEYVLSLAAGANVRVLEGNDDGINAKVFVNDTLITETSTQLMLAQTTPLGKLNEGDTIYLAFGAGNYDSHDDSIMDFNLVRLDGTRTEGAYRDDFQSASPPAGWQYLWNAPAGWSLTEAGDGTSGAIDDVTSFVALQPSGENWSADGDSVGINSPPAGFLTLSADGGHPGRGANDIFENSLDRYAIAAYSVPSDGQYDLYGALARRYIGQNLDRELVSLKIFLEDKLLLENLEVTAEAFYLDVGSLAAGETIYLAVGAGTEGLDFSDGFRWDFHIVSRSEAVPEPANLLLLGMSVVAAWFRWGRSRTSRHIANF